MTTTPRSGDRSLLRRMNTHAALLGVRDGQHTVTGLADQLGISRTAAEDVVRDLVDLGWVAPADTPASARPGRPARSYRFAAEAGHVVGLDIGVHKILGIVADLEGRPRASHKVSIDEDASAADRLALATTVVETCLAEAGLDMEAVWCAGVGSPGVIDAAGTVTRYGGNGLPGWLGLDLANTLSTRWGVPVRVESDNNLGTIAEHWRGSAQDARDVVYILSGNRTSAGILIGGSLYRGHSGGSGLVGALPQLGWAEAPRHVESLAGTGVEPTREAMFLAARDGIPHALAALDGFAASIATGVVAMSLAVDPELIVLGGGISRGGEIILDAIRSHIDDLQPHAPRVVLSTLGDESVAMGAVRIALDAIDAQLLASVQAEARFPSPSRGILTL